MVLFSRNPKPTGTWESWVAEGKAIRFDADAKLIVRPSTGRTDTASVFVNDQLAHIPKADAPRIAAILLRAAGWAE